MASHSGEHAADCNLHWCQPEGASQARPDATACWRPTRWGACRASHPSALLGGCDRRDRRTNLSAWVTRPRNAVRLIVSQLRVGRRELFPNLTQLRLCLGAVRAPIRLREVLQATLPRTQHAAVTLQGGTLFRADRDHAAHPTPQRRHLSRTPPKLSAHGKGVPESRYPFRQLRPLGSTNGQVGGTRAVYTQAGHCRAAIRCCRQSSTGAPAQRRHGRTGSPGNSRHHHHEG